jgi:hypothetical protein
MIGYEVESSPQLYARIGGGLYVIIIALGIFQEAFVRNKIFVSGDAAATAANLAAMEPLWRWGIAAEFVVLICTIFLAAIYFFLLRPVSKELNLVATFLRLISIAVETVVTLNLDTALFPVANSPYLKAFTTDQLNAMVSLIMKEHGRGFSFALLVLGFCFLVHGYLIFKSGYLPWWLGTLIQIAGLAYLVNSFSLILTPNFAVRIFPAILLPALIGETSLSLWLLVKGVNVEKWREANTLLTRGGLSR